MSEKWPPTENHPAPAIGPNFQKSLTEIFGTTPKGWPKLRVVWGQERREFYHEQLRLSYPCARGDRRTIIGTPRWFVEQWVGPNIAGQGWEDSRYEWKYDPIRQIHREVDMIGDPPRDGMYLVAEYVYPFMLAVHQSDGLCCINKRKEGFRCYGQYRDPDDRDLYYIASLVDELKGEPHLHDYDQLPPREVVEASLRKRIDQLAEQERKEEVRLVEGLKDEIRPHAKRLVTDGGRLDKETYHFQGIGKSVKNWLKP